MARKGEMTIETLQLARSITLTPPHSSLVSLHMTLVDCSLRRRCECKAGRAL